MIPSYSAVLAHIILREKLHIFGVLGCILCVVGSTTIVLHAPQEREIESVTEVWQMAMEPGTVWNQLFRYIIFVSIVSCFMELKKFTTVNFFRGSFSFICDSGHNFCYYTYIPLYTSIWPDTHNGLYWSLFPFRFFIGTYTMFVINCSLCFLSFTSFVHA